MKNRMIERFESFHTYSEPWRSLREARLAKSGVQQSTPAMFDVCIKTIRNDKNSKLPRGIERRFPVDKNQELQGLGRIAVQSIKNALATCQVKQNC